MSSIFKQYTTTDYKKISPIYWTAIFWLMSYDVYGQGIAPLQLTTQLLPPYSSNINDYITSGSEKMRLIVLQRDLTQANYRFYLRMELSVNGTVLFRTPVDWMPPEFIHISPGIPTIIDGTQLQQYFDVKNLDFVGYSREQYMRTGNLPEGFTNICFTAYDAGRPEVSVSNPACGMYYLTLSDPPMLAIPACGSDVLARTPQQMVFNWIAMGMGKITATPTQYEFSLYENRDGRNPNEVVESLRPIYTQQTTATMLVYGMAEPMLTEGMQYVWRVQAIDEQGKTAYKNNGYSTPCTFTYKNADQYNWQQAPTIKLRADVLNHERVKLVYNWDKALPYDEYFLEFHKPGKENAWFSATRADTVYYLGNLEEDMQYEARVTGIKGANKGKTSETVRFRTAKKKVANCKETPSVLATYNGRPYTSAMKNDLIKFGDFELTINQLQKLPEPGWYRGTGYVKVDFMAGMQFKVKFENLQIDDRLEGTAGELVFMREGMEEWKEKVLSVTEVVKDLVKNVQQLLKHYTGTESDKKEIAAAQKQVNEQYELLFNNPYLAQPTKDSLKQIQTKTKESWDALAKGRKCTETEKVVENKSKGPYIYNDYLGDEYNCYTNQVAQELEEIESGVNTIASEKAEGLDCYCNQSPTIADYLLKLNPFSGESPCVFVQKALKRIKESVGDQEFSFITSRETEANQLISETECLSIMGEEIKKTRIIYFTEQLQQMGKSSYSFHFNKNDLQDYAYKGDAKNQRGLIHYNKKGISDFMILIDEEDDVKFEKQREVLKKYLGIGGGGYIVKPKYSVAIGSVPIVGLQITQQGIDFITYHEEGKNPTLHVYNDFKSSKSKYCNEHYEYDMNNNLIGIKSGHNTHAKWSSRKCIDDSHVGIIKDKRGYGNPTIGWGHLITTEAELKRFCITKDAKITLETANIQLQDEFNEVTRQLKNALPNISLSQCQFDALMSIVFNRGIGCERCPKHPNGSAFKGSKLYNKLNNGVNLDNSEYATLIINDGSKLAGTARRKDEADLFNNCKYR